MRISINDIPLVVLPVKGQCSSRFPFNNLILESGWATVRYEMLPLKGETQLNKEAYLNCWIELYDIESTNRQPLVTTALYETPPHEKTIIPYMVHEDTFRVNVPYKINGWKPSVTLDHFKRQLTTMVVRKYNDIMETMRNKDFAQYRNDFREREDIIAECFYLSETEKQGRMKDVCEAISNSTKIVPLTSEERLELGANGRLVRLIKNDGESALRIRNDNTKEETILDMWLHMKPESIQLTII